MPNVFLTDTQKDQYGRYVDEPDEEQLSRYFHLDDADSEHVQRCRGGHNRLGFALQLTTVRFLGTFLADPLRVPRAVVWFLARQLSITDVDCLSAYGNRKSTWTAHRTVIQRQYGYHEFSTPPWRFRLSRYLYSHAWIGNERPSLMFDYATSWLIQRKVLLPGVTTLARLVSEIRDRATRQVWHRLSVLPSADQKEALDRLLEVPENQRSSRFDEYRKGPVTISGPSFVNAVKRYHELRAFGMQTLDFSRVPPARLNAIARHAGITSQYKIARMPVEKRVGMLMAFVRAFEVDALDDALDVLDLLIADISSEAKRIGKKKRLRTLKDLDRSALTLAQVCSLVLNEDTQDNQLREAIFACVSKDQLRESVETVNALARQPDVQFRQEMVDQYGRVKRFMSTLLHGISFRAAPAGKAVLDAFHFLAELGPTRKLTLDGAPLGIISKPWRHLVFDKQKRVTTAGYALCFLDQLQDRLRRRDVYVSQSIRWGDPRDKLLAGAEWQSQRIQVCRSLGHPISGKAAIGQLTRQLDDTYQKVASHFDTNDSARIDNSGNRPTVTIKNLDKLDDPASLTALKEHIGELLPKVDLTELVLEINELTGFADEFTHVSEASARVDDLSVSVSAVLIAEACNIGLEPLIQSQVPALTRHRLSWVKQNYLRADTLIRANAKLVDHQSTLPLANRWGGGDVASADGLRFVTPVKTLHAGLNPKYFKRGGRGITWYNFMSDQFSGFHGIVIPGTLRDSIYVLEGLLEQQTGLQPTEIMTDTTGASDLVFGLFWLLGYQFSPRLADAGEARFWRVDPDANYGPLDTLARSCIKTGRMTHHWDDMLRVTGSLKLGTIHASELIRSLLKSERPSSLALAIMEAGRINKTVYLLNYVDDIGYRRRILTQLNRTEDRHSVARVICHGRRGEIRKRYREGQEDQLGALGIVTNAVVLWNTIYMQDALDHLAQKNTPLRDEDIAGLSPLRHRHLNVLGHYSFTLAEPILNGEHRPLRQFERDFEEDSEALLATLDRNPERT